MKIAFINTLYYPNRIGGAEKSVQILAETMAKYGHKVICISLKEPHNMQSTIYHNNVKCYYVPLKNIYWPFFPKKNEAARILWHLIDIYNFRMVSPIKRIIENERPDIVHTNNLSGFSASIWKIPKSYNIPIVHTLRDYYLMCHLSTMFRNGANCETQCFRCRLIGSAKKYYSNLPDAVVGISKYILEKHVSHGYFNKVQTKHVVYNSIGMLPIKRYKKNDRLRIGYIGRVEFSKGIGIFLDIAKRTINRPLEFHVAGSINDGSLLSRMKTLKSNLFYHGFVDSGGFFKKIDVLIVPSLWNEPFGRIILEAYVHGIPVIGSNKGGIPEIIEDGKTGYVFHSDSIADLESKILIFLDNPRIINSMQKNIKKRVEKYSRDRIDSQYMKIYNTILHQNDA